MNSCELCYKEFKSKKGLTYHINKNICVYNDFKCEYCNSSFKYRSNYYRHKKNNCEVAKLENKLKIQNKLIIEKDKLIQELQEKQVNIIGDHNINGNNNKVLNIHINNYGQEDADKLCAHRSRKCSAKKS